jgi:spore coat protein CotH
VDVKAVSGALYDPAVVRTIFLDFENADWEAELQDFHGTDVDVPATVTIDGQRYPGVGVHFRGMSSFAMVPAGHKRSFNLSFDLVDARQRVMGRKTLNLLNSNGDASFMSTVLYSEIANRHIAAPRANHVQVVINGESWGVYVNVEQFDQDFVNARFAVRAGETGARWKVQGSPMGRGGLDYLGDSVALYKARYELKSRERAEDWVALIELTRRLNATPLDSLERALRPILDLDGVLWFLALDVGLMNSDGYWARASDYSLYRDPGGVFHVVPHDMNEAFREEGGPMGMRPPGGFGRPREGSDTLIRRPPVRREPTFTLDPLVGITDPLKPLRSRLLAVPALRDRYLANMQQLARESLDWQLLGPRVATMRARLEPLVAADTRKNSTHEAFLQATDATGTSSEALRSFADRRRAFLLAWRPPS